MNYWIFQAVPQRYQLPQKMKTMGSDRWFVTRYRDEIKANDVVYFWLSGKSAGVYGWGYVISPEPSLALDGDYRTEVSYNTRFATPISKAPIVQQDGLKELHVIRVPQGTNFRVKPQEAVILNSLIRQAGYNAPPDPKIPDGGNNE